jgi:membrane protein implicated in regulation of membrane protease activity
MTILSGAIIISILLSALSTIFTDKVILVAVGVTLIIIFPLRVMTTHGTTEEWLILVFVTFAAALISGLAIKFFKTNKNNLNQGDSHEL